MSMRTRHQRQLAEQAGEAPSPPHRLIDEPRPKRTRIQKPDTTQTSSSLVQPVAQSSSKAAARPSKSTRTSRAAPRGRARGGRRPAQLEPSPQLDVQEISDASTQPDASAQSDISTQVAGETSQSLEDDNGETPTSYSGSSAHPVADTIRTPKTANAQPVLAANVGITRSTLNVQSVHDNRASPPTISAARRVSASLGFPPTPEVPGRSSPSDTSILFAQLLSSPITLGTNPGPHPAAGEVPGLALVESPDSSPESAPQKGTTRVSSKAANHMLPDPTSQGERSDSFHGLSSTRNSQNASYPLHSAMLQPHGVPHVRSMPHSLIHVLVDAHPQTSRHQAYPRSDQSVTFSIPTEALPLVFSLASQVNPELKDFQDTDPVAARVRKESMLNHDIDIDMRYRPFSVNRKRKRGTDDEDDSSPPRPSVYLNQRMPLQLTPQITAKNVRVMRHNMFKMAQETKRVALEEAANPPGKRVRSIVKKVPDMYDQTGSLRLGNWKYVSVDVDAAGREIPQSQKPCNSFTENEPPEQQDSEAVLETQIPETPRPRTWGISSLIPSSVSKYLPFTSTRSPPAAAEPPTTVPGRITSVASPEASDPAVEKPRVSQALLESFHRRYHREAQTEPRQRHSDMEAERVASIPKATGELAKRNHTEKPKKRLLTKAQAAERADLKKEKEELRAEKARLEQEKKEWEEYRKGFEATHAPGTKRKRVPSPEVIPLPPGGGFGLHDDYFTYDSSDEEDLKEQETPTKPPAKKARVASTVVPTTEDLSRATPYRGEHFALPNKPLTPDSAIVLDDDLEATNHPSTSDSANVLDGNDQATSGKAKPDRSAVTPSVSSGAFVVPSPGESDDEEDTENVDNSLPSPTRTLVDPVEKARKKALQHQPRQGSKLKELTRLSSPILPSGSIDQSADRLEEVTEVDTELDDSQYDPKRPALVPPSNTIEETGISQSQAQPTSGSTGEIANEEDHPDEMRLLTGYSRAQVAKLKAEGKWNPSLVKPRNASEVEKATTNQGTSSTETSKTVDTAQPLSNAELPELGIDWAYESYQKTMSPKVHTHLDKQWGPEDIESATKTFDSELQTYKKQEVSNATMYKEQEASKATRNLLRSMSSTYGKAERTNVSPRVRAFLDAKFDESDEVVAGEAFDDDYEAWKTEELRKQSLQSPSIVA